MESVCTLCKQVYTSFEQLMVKVLAKRPISGYMRAT